MGSVFVQVEVEDATLESLSAGLQSELTDRILEAAVRNALWVPADKRVVVEPFRNGIVLSVGMAQTVEDALEELLEDWQATPDPEAVREALAYVRAGLEVIQRHGG